MTDDDISALAERCRTADTKRILITHGTSTMVRSARAIATALGADTDHPTNDKVVVITGSLLPRVFTETDADFNLGVAVGALGALSPGVYVAMSGVVYRYDQVARDPLDGSFVPHTTPGCVAADDPGIAVTLASLKHASTDDTNADSGASVSKRARCDGHDDDTISEEVKTMRVPQASAS